MGNACSNRSLFFSFLIGGDEGWIFEGRGWTYRGSHTPTANSNSIGVAFIGKYGEQGELKIIIETRAASPA